ncbi:hypothetical protein FOZ61_002899, partial [Perkinsus olseni]
MGEISSRKLKCKKAIEEITEKLRKGDPELNLRAGPVCAGCVKPEEYFVERVCDTDSISVFIVRLPLMVSSLVLLVAAVQISPRVVGDLRVKVLRHHESDAHCGVFSENNQKALFHLTYTVTGSPLFETASLVCNDPRHFAAKSISDMKKAAKFSRGESEMADAVLNTLEARTIKKLPSNANKGKTCKQRLLDFYKYNENAIKKTTTGLCGPIEDAGCMFTYYMCGEALTIYNKMESEPKPPTFKKGDGYGEFELEIVCPTEVLCQHLLNLFDNEKYADVVLKPTANDEEGEYRPIHANRAILAQWSPVGHDLGLAVLCKPRPDRSFPPKTRQLDS